LKSLAAEGSADLAVIAMHSSDQGCVRCAQAHCDAAAARVTDEPTPRQRTVRRDGREPPFTHHVERIPRDVEVTAYRGSGDDLGHVASFRYEWSPCCKVPDMTVAENIRHLTSVGACE